MDASFPHESCAGCGSLGAREACEAIRRFDEIAAFIEEPHLSARLKRCAACGGAWLAVFTERIDWAGGNDPQLFAYVPISPEEHAGLDAGNVLDRARQFGRDRRFLVWDWPSDGSPRVEWTRGGSVVGPHD